MPGLPQPGMPGFAPALVAAVASSPMLRGWPVDGTLTAVLLLALMARRGGVILDAVGSTAKVAKVVGALTASVFGLETRFMRLSHSSVAADAALGPPSAADPASEPKPRPPAARAVVITGLEDAPPPVLVQLRGDFASAERSRNAPLIVWVRDEERDEAPGWLIDIFACSALIYADELVAPPPGLGVTALIPPEYILDLRSLLLLTHIHPPLESHINNLLTALSLHPTLEARLTSRASACFNTLIKGQRILAGPFELPEGWLEHLRAWRADKWAEAEYDAGAGSSLPASALHSRTLANKGGYGGGPGGVDTWGQRAGETPTPASMLGPGATDWYCDPDNVEGAFELAIRHRVHVRRPGEATLFALNGSAQERVQYARQTEAKGKARQRRKEIDAALVRLLQEV
ncbi:hypothetical protein CC85DRAFT_304398 [Cutaneotrichosporon oleaginosum]|uniref:Uncharacterized protein n=1 Tax=Cutaneotrichosporon oleaginosum TaxID=879819 RepID=A0A0J0XGH3_9TREE|nr:uncharacterized protein CC85DRAFT_304398 [Cutaneotrichosporon oleaginosum]KLT40163.1 hypothetical protein CC85DRAFT_304398 [Cutaneotrichosporon oleaginosum]TXT06872.1 hypothetical protein COLE_06203 [Cutaneotrichosporon oleaginosum]